MELRDFIDIHCHLLPGLDDGPKNLEQSLELARRYCEAGIGKVITTPHYLPGTAWTASPARIVELTANLRHLLAERGLRLDILPGMEIAIQKRMADRLKNNEYLPLGRSRAYLLEPPLEAASFDPLEAVEEFIRVGKEVILAHPERCEYFQDNPEFLRRAHGRRIGVQINLGSLLGRFGPRAAATARRLVNWEAVDYLASDSHSARRRPPDAGEWRKVEKMFPPELLNRVAARNPGKLFARAGEGLC